VLSRHVSPRQNDIAALRAAKNGPAGRWNRKSLSSNRAGFTTQQPAHRYAADTWAAGLSNGRIEPLQSRRDGGCSVLGLCLELLLRIDQMQLGRTQPNHIT